MTDNNRFMKYPVHLILLLLIPAAIISCKKDTAPVAVAGGALSAENIVLSPTGDEFLLTFSSDRPWTLSMTWPDGYPEWLDIDRQSGKAGTSVVSLRADLNDLRTDRSADIVFNADDGSYHTEIHVAQPYPYLIARHEDEPIVSGIDLYYAYDEYAGSENPADQIEISSNVQWGVISDKNPGNFNISQETGNGDGTLEIYPAAPNFGREPYTHVFDIVPLMEDDGGTGYIQIPEEATDHYRISLTQDNFTFLLNDKVNDIHISFSDMNETYDLAYLDMSGVADGTIPGISGTVPADIAVEAETAWHISECPEWIKTNETEAQNIVLNISPDGVTPTAQDRAGTVTLTADEDSRAERRIDVIQEGYLFEINSEELGQDMSVSIPGNDLSEHSLTLDTRGPWEILNIPDSWLAMTPESCQESYVQSGVSSHEISFRALDKNLEFEDRIADITFSRTVKPEGITDDPMDINVSIVQNAFIFNVTPDPVLSAIPFFNTLPYQVQVDCSGPWRIESAADWLNIPETSGEAGTMTIWINAKTANPYEGIERSATVEVISIDHENADMDVRRSFEVVQQKYTFEFTPDPDIQHIPAYKHDFPEYEAALECSASWELTSWPSWLTPDITSGDGMENVSIMFTPQINTSASSRSGTVTVRDSYKEQEKSFEAAQDGFVFDDSPVTFNGIPVMNSNIYPVTFSLTAEAHWELISYPDWTNPSEKSGTAASHGEVTVNFTPEPNPELKQRSGNVIIKSTVNNGEKTVAFMQDPFEFDDTPESYSFTELDDRSEELHVECSGPWTVNAPSWVVFSPSSGSSSQTVRVSVTSNTSLDDRTADCRITSSLNGLTRDIQIAQDAFKFDSGALSFAFDAIDDTEKQFAIICSGSWTAGNVPAWINLSASKGAGSEDGTAEEIILTVGNNMEIADRNVTIAFTSDDNPSLVKNVTVTQAGFVFEVSPLSCEFGPEADDARITVECSGEWTAACPESWVVISPAGNGGFDISVKDNGAETGRTATVTVRSTMNGLTEEILVTQSGTDK